MKMNQLKISLVVGFVSVSCVAPLFLSQNSFADDIVTDVAVDVPAACTIAGTVDTPHTREMESGTYRQDIGTTTFKVICNDNSGFSVYAVGYSNEKIGNNKMLATVSGELAPSFDIVTGTASSGSTSNWAMKLSPVAGTYAPTILSDTNGSFSSYHIVPESYARVATFPNGTDGTNGSAFTSTYATYVTSAQPSGTYNSKVKYTIVHPANEAAPPQPQPSTAGCITYYANASTAQGTMGTQCNLADGVSITLYASNFSRTGYGFAGWTNKYDYATNTDSDLKFYGPMETITVPEGTTANGLSLYAVWVKSVGTLQDADKVAELCGTTTTDNILTKAPTNGTANLSSVSALTDQRDNQTYAIAKLADGKCWMIENLRLESTAEHNSDGTLAQGYGASATYGNFGGLADAESTGFTTTYTANSLYYSGTQEGTASIDIGTTNYPGRRMPRYNNLNTTNRATNPTSNTFPNNNTTGGMYSYGNYYTWHAAIADLTYNGTNNQSTTGTSLCPTGWHLPKGGDKTNEANNELWSLIVDGINGGTKPANYDSQTYPYYDGTPEGSDASNKLRAYPNNFLYSGLFNTSSARYRGSGGYYWSSTAYDYVNSYRLYLSSSGVDPGTHDNTKYYGQSIRCTVGT